MSGMESGRQSRLVTTLMLVLLFVSAILQSGTAWAQDANPARDLPNAPVQRGVTFDVIVTFTAPSNDFNAIGLIDNIPAGWTIQIDKTWCTPKAIEANIDDIPLNQAQYVWFGPYDVGQEFTALYKVTVPANAEFDTYLFDGELGYNIAGSTRIFKDIGGDSSTDVTVADPSTIPTPSSIPSPTLIRTPAASLSPTPSSTPSPTLTSTPTSSPTPTATPAPSPTPTPIPATTGGLGLGAWTGIGIGILAGILLLVGLVMWIVKRQRINKA